MGSLTRVWGFNNSTKVWEFARFNSETDLWEGTLTEMVDGRGYFVRSTSIDPIEVLLRPFSPQTGQNEYELKAGWNAIGYTPGGAESSATVEAYLSSLGSSWKVLRTWNSTDRQYETAWDNETYTTEFPDAGDEAIVESGKGYLVFLTADGSLAP